MSNGTLLPLPLLFMGFLLSFPIKVLGGPYVAETSVGLVGRELAIRRIAGYDKARSQFRAVRDEG